MFLVTRCARKSTRQVCGGNKAMTDLKAQVNRSYRREVKQELNSLKTNPDNREDATFQPSRKLTGWDIS
jgi:hypothetical protein